MTLRQPDITKRHRLSQALASRQKRARVANNVLAFIQDAMHPARYVGNSRLFGEQQARLKWGSCSLAGLRLNDEGRIQAA
jgi:hypothetical protein